MIALGNIVKKYYHPQYVCEHNVPSHLFYLGISHFQQDPAKCFGNQCNDGKMIEVAKPYFHVKSSGSVHFNSISL